MHKIVFIYVVTNQLLFGDKIFALNLNSLDWSENAHQNIQSILMNYSWIDDRESFRFGFENYFLKIVSINSSDCHPICLLFIILYYKKNAK